MIRWLITAPGHISSDEAKNLIEHLERAIDWPDVRFYPGKSYRHLMVIKDHQCRGYAGGQNNAAP